MEINSCDDNDDDDLITIAIMVTTVMTMFLTH